MSWRRTVNRRVAPVTAVMGTLIIFGGVLLVDNRVTAIMVVAAGVLLLEAGVWYMANPIFTNERQFTRLREQLDHFIGLVRQINKAVIAADQQDRVDQLNSAMHASVDEICRLAGVGDDEPVDHDATKVRPEST